MNSKSRQTLNSIKNKVKDKITGQKRFSKDDEVIDLALELLLTKLKEERLM